LVLFRNRPAPDSTELCDWANTSIYSTMTGHTQRKAQNVRTSTASSARFTISRTQRTRGGRLTKSSTSLTPAQLALLKQEEEAEEEGRRKGASLPSFLF
jgi:hypothetical protein